MIPSALFFLKIALTLQNYLSLCSYLSLLYLCAHCICFSLGFIWDGRGYIWWFNVFRFINLLSIQRTSPLPRAEHSSGSAFFAVLWAELRKNLFERLGFKVFSLFTLLYIYFNTLELTSFLGTNSLCAFWKNNLLKLIHSLKYVLT